MDSLCVAWVGVCIQLEWMSVGAQFIEPAALLPPRCNLHLVTRQEVSGLVAFLCMPTASYISGLSTTPRTTTLPATSDAVGQTVAVDGAFSVHGFR